MMQAKMTQLECALEAQRQEAADHRQACSHLKQEMEFKDEKLDRWAGMMGQWRKRVDDSDPGMAHTRSHGHSHGHAH